MTELLPIADSARTWNWLRRALIHRRRDVSFTLAVGLVGAAMSVVPIYVLGALVDRVTDGEPTSAIIPIAVVITIAALLGGLASGFSSYLVAKLGEGILAELRELTVSRALRLPTPVLERVGKGDLLSRVGADVAAIGKAVTDVVPTMISSLLLGVLSIVAMLGLDWRLGLAGLVSVPMYAVALRWYLPKSAPRYAEERQAIAARSQVLVESTVGIRTVHAYGLERRHLRAVDEASARARDISVDVFTLFTRFSGRVNRAEFFGLTVILVVGFVLVRSGDVSVGQSAAAALLFHRLFNPIGMLLFTFDEVQDAGASLARLVGVVEIADTKGPDSIGAVPTESRPAGADLDLREIEYSYDGGEPVLHGVSIHIAAGSRVALVGSTGAGKSTLAAIAAGVLVPDHGSALVGGVALTDMTAEQLRTQVAIVSQEVHVFAGPLIEDIRLARPSATDDEVSAALDSVGALDWVRSLPNGLQTEVGEGAHDLSAAKAQQLALARLVLLDPAVAVLDEATAEAGSLGARFLEQSAAAATKGRTTLVVAHRLTQAVAADRVIVLEHGRIVEEGAHADLVEADGRYAQLWSAWQTGGIER
ncbi:ABC transporter ATP-binding protein [Antrihabitans sp. NCIMB 15449]|uniref:ABC transporter ATP-binding protein n=1 Tax=Antrihabitans spumae TaxID=3373370 RepID=A0ABW7JI58_9NOCA